MSKKALIDALEAGPTEGATAFDDEDNTIIDPNVPDVAVLSVERMDIDGDGHYWFGPVSQANAAFYAAANPATIRALLADLERAEKAQAVVSRLLPLIFDCAKNKQHESVLALVTQMSTELAQMAGG